MHLHYGNLKIRAKIIKIVSKIKKSIPIAKRQVKIQSLALYLSICNERIIG